MEDDVNMPPCGPKQLPPRSGDVGPKLPTGSTATNGHWLHDAAGPAVLVDNVSGPVSRLRAMLLAKFPQLCCSVEDVSISVEGAVDTPAQGDEVHEMIEEIDAGMPIVVRLTYKGWDAGGRS